MSVGKFTPKDGVSNLVILAKTETLILELGSKTPEVTKASSSASLNVVRNEDSY